MHASVTTLGTIRMKIFLRQETADTNSRHECHCEARRAVVFKILISLYGIVWLGNAMFEAGAWLFGPQQTAHKHLIDVFAKAANNAPEWLKPTLLGVTNYVHIAGPHTIAIVMVTLSTLIGFALLTRLALRPLAVFGFAYSLVLWLVLEALGFPYSHGQTDPHVMPVYALIFLFILAIQPEIASDFARNQRFPNTLWNTARRLFGILWLFDAGLKWLPAFMFHFVSQITAVIPGQPPWIAAWLNHAYPVKADTY